MKDLNDMLVSVVVVTYNSSEFIIEALDSVKAQTYQNIELIISDDCSEDNTVILCKNWINENSTRFTNCELLTYYKNTGNTANYNRGWKRAKGEWIKNLDGDDRLLPNCISDYLDFVKKCPKADMVFAKMNSFNSDGMYVFERQRNMGGILLNRLSRWEFEIAVYLYNTINSPTTFIKRVSFLKLGGYDEAYKYIEDWPMWMRMVNERYNLQYMDKTTVDYRISNYSISQGTTNENKQNEFNECDRLVRERSVWYLRNHSLFSKIYFYTKDRKDSGSHIWRVLNWANILNPFYHRYVKVLQ